MVKRGGVKYVKIWNERRNVIRGIREKIFINDIGNTRKIGSIGNVENLKMENVEDINKNKKGSIVGRGWGVCKNLQGLGWIGINEYCTINYKKCKKILKTIKKKLEKINSKCHIQHF